LENIEKHVSNWLDQSNQDWEVVHVLFQSQYFGQCLFWAHLVVEKICKALWIKNLGIPKPPRTHNLLFLLEEAEIEVDLSQKRILIDLGFFQSQGRYPDDLYKIESEINFEKANELLQQIDELRKWLISKLG
jgi:HEPN domain-containing protein